VAAGDTYIRAKQDKPGHCCACGCMAGKFCTRWWVFSASGIGACAWLNLEDGVSVKFDGPATAAAARHLSIWQRTDEAVPITYSIIRQALPILNRWFILISEGTCIVRAIVPQALDEQLWTGAADIDFTVLGVCDVNPPIDTLNLASYQTEAAALVDWPDLQVWDWD